MQRDGKVHLTVTWPLFVIEDRANDYTIYDILSRQSDFLTFGRLPPVGKFRSGHAFDAGGKVYRYQSEAGWPRFSRRWKGLLENLIVPGPVFKLVSCFVYYGPALLPGEQLGLPDFRARILERMLVYEKGRDARQLKRALEKASSYPEVIAAIDWYRFHGGRRDADGHLLDESDP
jgi:hypothetical protein